MHNWIHIFEFGIRLCNKYSTVNNFNKSGWDAGVGGRCSWVPRQAWRASGGVAGSQLGAKGGGWGGVGPFLAGRRMARVGGRVQGHGGRRTGETLNIHKRSAALEWSLGCFAGRGA